MQHFHVSATGHSLNYLPQYVAQDLGFFADAGLTVTSEVPDPWMQVLKDIDCGRAAAALGGIWVPTMFYEKVRNYRAFCQMSARCPLVLMSRQPVAGFDWRQLDERLVLVTGTGGSGSYVLLSGLAHRAGLNRARIRFVRDLDYDMLLDLFLGGLGDYMLVDLPTSRRLVTEGSAHIALDLAQSGGPVPWSVYYAPAEALDETPELYARFLVALQRGLDWIHANPLSDLTDTVGRLWPDHASDEVIGWLEHFRASGMWNRTVEVDPDAFDVWQEMLARADLVERPLAYDEIVNAKPETTSTRFETNTS
ncbi:ABC transporter substrate-binding protein [Pseudaminobacter salicylatoxidans]|uniref:ABC transporter substrate-binding protein n=1 Tax=Pseudaminobacter salicylatoxidans TaxID=93369 RepID=UPI0002F49D60|nr:ABC transporter substrate-binding protein [Pseudaminobacter salicylatoxidans]